MARRFSSRRRGFRRRLPLKWCGNGLTAEDTTASGTQDSMQLIEPNDYRGGTTGNVEAGSCTLVRIRGQVSFRATVIGGLAYMGVYAIGASEGVPDPSTTGGQVSGDMLWSTIEMVPTDTSRKLEVDIKAKRRLEDDQVIFVIKSLGQTLTWAANFRCLIASHG